MSFSSSFSGAALPKLPLLRSSRPRHAAAAAAPPARGRPLFFRQRPARLLVYTFFALSTRHRIPATDAGQSLKATLETSDSPGPWSDRQTPPSAAPTTAQRATGAADATPPRPLRKAAEA